MVALTSIVEGSESLQQTPVSSTLPKNNEASDRELPDLYYYEIVWLNSDTENPVKFDRLRTISDCITFFDNIDNCREYIETVTISSDRNSLFLVTCGHLANKLVSAVYHLDSVSSINCLITGTCEEEWTPKDPKVSSKDH